MSTASEPCPVPETGSFDSRQVVLGLLEARKRAGTAARPVPDYEGAGEVAVLEGIAELERLAGTVTRAIPVTRATLRPLEASAGPVPAAGQRSRRTPSPWPDTRHRLFIAGATLICVAALWAVQDYAWPGAPRLHGAFAEAWKDAGWIWLAPLPASLFNIVGLLSYRPSRNNLPAKRIPYFVCWRIVSRGTNTEALAATIRRCQLEMRASPLFPYVIEVVTDTANPLLPRGPDIAYLVVPDWYQTPKGSLFKARALQYALEHSPLAGDAWIVHLDEESRPVPSGIRGIARMIAEEEASGRLRIGQGAITYHRSWRKHPFLTLADMPRTGDDLGRFYLAYRSGVTLFGMHGSFIVVRNDVEKAAGFDFGPVGSVTEDAFWALCEMEAGNRCRWVDGFLEEQSTQGIADFLKQRRRWFQGIVKVCLHAPVRLRWRITFGVSTVLWALAPLGMAYTFAHLVIGGGVGPAVKVLADVALAGCVTVQLMGVKVNLDEHGILEVPRRLMWYALALASIPAAGLLEAASVGYAVARPDNGFHVVGK